MNIYECVTILSHALSEEEAKSAVTRVSDLIASAGGEVMKVDQWGKRRLAYELNKQKMGIYILFIFKAPAGVIRRLEDFFRVFDPVIKFMVIKLEKKQVAALPPDVLGVPVSPQEISPAPEPKIDA